MACDGESSSYWASKFDVAGPVSFTVDVGSLEEVAEVQLDFEFAPRSFALYLSTDGQQWLEVFSTDANVLKKVKLPVGGQLASVVKLELREAHPVHGAFAGHSVYGIRSFAVMAQRLRAVVESCGVAAKSPDARDKYFTAAVDSYDPAAGATLRGELPSLEAAGASLAATVAELAEALPGIASCKVRSASLQKVSDKGHAAGKRAAAYGLDESQVKALYDEARATILAARRVLR